MLQTADEIKQAEWFSNHFNCELSRIENQRIGSAKDYTIKTIQSPSTLPVEAVTQHIEFKFDKMAKLTGNLYLETRQTFNFGESYQPSGMRLAVSQSMYIVFSVPHFKKRITTFSQLRKCKKF